MLEAALAPGARIECRSAEWLVRRLGKNSDGQMVAEVEGISPFLRGREAHFLVDVEKAANSFKVLQPQDTELVEDRSPHYRDSLLFIEAHLRRTVPTDDRLVVGPRAAMNSLPYQLEPAAKALAMPRQRLLIADAVGLGKTLECGILCSELIRRGRGQRILVVTTKSMLVQFQKEFWSRFSIPLVRLDSVGIQRIREQIPTNQNPFHHYDKAIISVDTLKRDREYRVYLENANWDIIVIDECQNVAERAQGRQRSQRTQLAHRLTTRSDTLILLSATPHDGKAESFASLMNMLDPTAIANPSHYGKADIKDLYIRRFRKDVIADLRETLPERDSQDVTCQASPEEERVFAALKDLKLPESDARAKAEQLFRTTLVKSMLSSPVAALETVRNRLGYLAAAASPSPADQAALEELVPLLEAIGPEQFSKYQRLIRLIRDGWRWNGRDPKDRLVIFTGRRASQRFLVEHLTQDLKLGDGAVVSLDGAMADVEQTKVVEQFGQEGEPVRILVATEVAAEGLNLHYLSHRLVHFDIPWSLMTLQQRNGRIDRYGQAQKPQICFMLTHSSTEGMGDAEKILRLLKRKDDQAQRNIGDPAVFLGKFDVPEEGQKQSEASEQGRADGPEAEMGANASPYLEQGSGDSLLEELFGTGASSSEPTPAPPPVREGTTFSLFPSLWGYVTTALGQVEERLRQRGEPALDMRQFPEQGRLEITPPEDLQRRYDHYPKELAPPKGERLALSTDVAALQQALEEARRKDSDRPALEYLWDLHPLVGWLVNRGQVCFERHCAPVLLLNDGLAPGEVVMVLLGTIPNQRGMAVVQEWVGVRFAGSGLRLAGVEPFEAIAQRLGLGRQVLANRAAPTPECLERLKSQRAAAVEAAHQHLLQCKQRWEEQMKPRLGEQRERLRSLRQRQVEKLDADYAADGSIRQVRERKRAEGMRRIEQRFQDHERFVEEVMTIESSPHLALVAVLHRGEA